MTHGYGSGQYELRGFNEARELLHLRFSGCRRWGLDKRKGMSSFSGMVSEMASLPSDGASDLPLEMQYMGFHGSISWFRFLARRESSLSGGTCDTCTDAWLERFDNEFNLLSTRTRGGRESYVKRTNDDERGEGGVGGVRRNQMITR
ncbi:hypothetical protein Bca101_071170 [Brassica carinata]